ncbi:dephospho-CoA kinase [Geomonas sp. RF6]|uniref:dephospho-CoA kinase n=1 Tax=Geomonas sp. RF6 TaxID=2897342 RepID=UPI001E2BAB7F|nr:dephospho-CoA kinase [Geomonas sp. RF6]UFS71525.1 dephospho-CoA kinase [Geomonas sp. RF6]
MRIIGLTGGIASGKSTVSAILEEVGCVIIDADLIAREVVQPGEPAYRSIVATFGEGVLSPDGTLDRKALGRLVFSDPEARRALERITHPAIAERSLERLASCRRAGESVVFYVAPLLIEAGALSRVTELWVVYVDEETQLSRLMEREGVSREEAQGRISAQMPMEEKKGYAAIVIDNRGTKEALREEVLRLWREEVGGEVS